MSSRSRIREWLTNEKKYVSLERYQHAGGSERIERTWTLNIVWTAYCHSSVFPHVSEALLDLVVYEIAVLLQFESNYYIRAIKRDRSRDQTLTSRIDSLDVPFNHLKSVNTFSTYDIRSDYLERLAKTVVPLTRAWYEAVTEYLLSNIEFICRNRRIKNDWKEEIVHREDLIFNRDVVDRYIYCAEAIIWSDDKSFRRSSSGNY